MPSAASAAAGVVGRTTDDGARLFATAASDIGIAYRWRGADRATPVYRNILDRLVPS
jgi:hypothetical protein